jgi:hypothetical protein
MSTCVIRKPSETDTELFDAMVHACLLLVILTVFYWKVIEPIAEKAVNDEVQRGISTTIDTITAKIKLTESQAQVVDTVIDPLIDKLIILYSRPDELRKQHNKFVFDSNVAAVFLMFGALCGSYLLLSVSCCKNVNVKMLIVENIFLFAAIGAVEYEFFMKVGKHFVPVAPSDMGVEFVRKLKQNLKNGN